MSIKRPSVLTDLTQADRFQLLIEAVKDYAIYLLDAEGKVATWNPGAQRFKGYTADEIIGQHFSVFYTPEDRANGMPARALHIAATEGRFEGEAQRMRKSGERFWASVVIDPIHDDHGGLVGFAKVTRDITERRKAQEELERSREALVQAQKMEAIGRLTGGVAHDFNNLLTVITSSAEFLLRPQLDETRRLRFAQAIADTAKRAAALTGQLLAFARRQPLKPEVFDVGARLEGLYQIISTTIGSSVTAELDLPDEIPVVEADPSQFDTAILNMVINARDAMPRGGEIRIAVRAADGVPAVRGHVAVAGEFVAIEIADTGSGIPAETLERIFEPFFTTKPIDKGTGLGLSQVYGFAKQSRGEIAVRSELGMGTGFTLYLPRSRAKIEPSLPARAVAENDHLTHHRILLVEDNESVGDFAASMLRELGQTVTLVGDGQSALDTLVRTPDAFDLVFSDVVMPGMSGVELGLAIRARWPALRVVLTSGYSHVIAEEGTHGFELLKKPYSIEEVLTILNPSARAGTDA